MEYRDLDVYRPVGYEIGRRSATCEQSYRIGARRYLIGYDDSCYEFKLIGDVHREAGHHRAVGIVPNQVLITPTAIAEGST